MKTTAIPISHNTAKPDAGAVLAALSADLAKPGDVEPLLERFLDTIVDMAGAQAGVVRLLDDDGHNMRLVAHLGLPETAVNAERLVERSCGMCGIASGSDVLGWVQDVAACAQHGAPQYFDRHCKSVLAISLPHGNQVLGIYNLFFDTKPVLDAPMQSLLRLIGRLLGLSLYNLRNERERLRVTVMNERQEMVNEVHDAIAQTLAYARMRLPLLSDAMLAHDDASSLKYFSDVKTAVTEVHDNLREVMTYFRTRMDPLGLLHALQGIAANFFSRNAITLEIQNTVPSLNLSDSQEVQVFHIIQEALANIAKHSMARRAMVAIAQTFEGLEFLIEDDGLGLDEPSVSSIVTSAKTLVPSTHFGLEIMQSRARRLGGRLEVGRKDGAGTRVRLVLPQHGTAVKARA